MLLSKEELETLAERHQKKADKAYMHYQETGTQRYLREHELKALAERVVSVAVSLGVYARRERLE